MFAGDLDAKRFRLEPIAFAGFAGDIGEILGKLLARPFALGLTITAVDVGDHSLERLLGVVGAYAVFIGKFDFVLTGAVQDGVLRLLRKILPFGIKGELVE